jgi:GT2 family glycosyltransferase
VPWELVVVGNGVPPALPDGVDLPSRGIGAESRLGWADARNLGLRHSAGEVTVILDTSLEPAGDAWAPLLAAFDDPRVGIAGGWGVTSGDARQFHEAPPGEVDAVEAYCLAIRRDALRAVRGFDHRFRFYRNADIDLSFAVRDAGWIAVRTEPLPFVRHEHRGWTSLPDAERDRLSRRNFYRFLDRWGARRDLLLRPDDE